MKKTLILLLVILSGAQITSGLHAENFNDDWTCYTSNNYRGGKKMLKAGEYNNCSSWRYYSWKSNCCVKFYFYYKNGEKGEKVLCGDVKDLKSEMRSWGDLKYGYQNTWKNIYKSVFYCDGNDNYADKNHNNNNNNNNNYGNYNDYLRKGQAVAWRDQGYKNSYEGYMPGKKYYPKDLKYKFWSLQCPQNYEVYWVYKGKNGQDEEYTCYGKISDLRSHFGKWNINNKNDAWDYVKYFEIRKKGQGGNNGNNYGKDDDYKNKDWYNKYRNGGYIVFTQYKYFDGRYAGKSPGDYTYKKLGFYPQAIFIPNYSIYLVLEYKAKNGKTESVTIKESIADLNKYLYNLGVYRDYEKDPYKAITRLAVIRQ
ncbi:MAG: hypothetical protein KDC53_06205 [Saprospiraceae bacterium]|nr:hypothetical protein [Saprospiraceae bacterium]